MADIEWEDIPGFEGRYKISSKKEIKKYYIWSKSWEFVKIPNNGVLKLRDGDKQTRRKVDSIHQEVFGPKYGLVQRRCSECGTVHWIAKNVAKKKNFKLFQRLFW